MARSAHGRPSKNNHGAVMTSLRVRIRVTSFIAIALAFVWSFAMLDSHVAMGQENQIIVSTLSGDGSGASFSSAAPILSSRGFGGRVTLPNDTMQLLRLPQIVNELRLDDEQQETIGKLSRVIHEQLRGVFRATDFSGDMRKIMQEAQREIRQKTEEKLEEVLLPQQLKRFKQIKIQMVLKNQGAPALMTGVLAEEIHLSDKQRKELMELHAKKQAELEKEIEALRERFRQETIREVLTSDQMKKVESLTGDDYQVKRPDYRAMYSRMRSTVTPPEKSKDK